MKKELTVSLIISARYPDAKEHVAEMRRIANRDSIVAFQVDAGNLEDSKAMMLSCTSTKMNQSFSRWSKVVFNFPHVGAGHKDESRNVLSNQLMLVRFLVSVAPFLTTGAVPAYASKGTKEVKKRSMEDEEDTAGLDQIISQEEDEEEDITTAEDQKKSGGFTIPPYAGSVLITLRNCKPYTLWDVPMLGKRLPSIYTAIASSAPSMSKGVKGPTAAQVDRLLSIGQGKPYRLWRSFQFRAEQWSVYSHRRTIGWKQGRSTSENEDINRSQDGENRTWELSLAG